MRIVTLLLTALFEIWSTSTEVQDLLLPVLSSDWLKSPTRTIMQMSRQVSLVFEEITQSNVYHSFHRQRIIWPNLVKVTLKDHSCIFVSTSKLFRHIFLQKLCSKLWVKIFKDANSSLNHWKKNINKSALDCLRINDLVPVSFGTQNVTC